VQKCGRMERSASFNPGLGICLPPQKNRLGASFSPRLRYSLLLPPSSFLATGPDIGAAFLSSVASLLTLDAWEGRGPTLRHRHLSRSRVSRSALLRLGGGGGACPSATRLWGGRLLPLWGGGGDYGDDDGSCPGWPSRLRGGGGKDADIEGEGEVDGNKQEESGDLDEDEDEDEDEGDVLDLGGEEGAVRGDVPDDAPEECPGTSSNMAGKSASCEGCPNQGACSSGDLTTQQTPRQSTFHLHLASSETCPYSPFPPPKNALFSEQELRGR
jgi:hypothetical protein